MQCWKQGRQHGLTGPLQVSTNSRRKLEETGNKEIILRNFQTGRKTYAFRLKKFMKCRINRLLVIVKLQNVKDKKAILKTTGEIAQDYP